MTKLAQSQFLANTLTIIVFGRTLTAAETTELLTAKKSVISSGNQVGPDQINTTTDTYSCLWSNQADADAYVAVANGFTPPPTTATVVAV
jgi:hypothetical protein